MTVTVEVEPINCLRNMSHSCITANLARAFLGNVTKESGVLCYAVNDSNTVNYRCCKGKVETQEVECDIPAVLGPEMAIIFTAVAIAAFIALLCFPALSNIVPDKKNSETLYANSQVHNPLYHFIISIVQALRHYSTKYYCVNVIRKLLIVFALPTLYYIDLGLQYYTKTYDIPKMFNEYVKKLWVFSKNRSVSFLFVILVYYGVVLLASFLPRTENLKCSSESLQSLLEKEKDIKINWLEPFLWIKDFFCWLKSLFGKATDSERSFFSRLAALLGSFVLMLLSPVVIVFISISYIAYVSPLGKMMRSLVYHASYYYLWIFECDDRSSGDVHICFYYVIIFSLCVAAIVVAAIVVLLFFCLVLAFGVIFESSLLLFTNLIVYVWMGLVASKDYYFPRIAVFAVFVYYSWNCLSSVKSRYQILLEQTFKKYKKHQEKQPNGRKALTFDEEGVPRISSELFQHVIDRILPRSVVYTNMILKLTIIILFLCLTFSSILIYGRSNLDESTKALAVFLTGLVPKMVEVFGEGSSCRHLWEVENACRVEKIVKDFLNQSDDDNSDNGITMNHDEEQPSSKASRGQAPTTNINKHDQPSLAECPIPKPVHSNIKSKKTSEGNGSREKNLPVVQADVNPRVQSINSSESDGPSTERTPLLLGQRDSGTAGQRDSGNGIA